VRVLGGGCTDEGGELEEGEAVQVAWFQVAFPLGLIGEDRRAYLRG
jgi:hypothetical protein